MGQSAARKKHKAKQKRHKIKILIANVFQESKKLHKTMFLYSKLYIQHPGDICFTQAVILSPTSNFVASIVPRYNKHATASQKYDQRLHFLLPSTTDFSGNIGFFQRVKKVTYVGCNWLISIHDVDLTSW